MNSVVKTAAAAWAVAGALLFVSYSPSAQDVDDAAAEPVFVSRQYDVRPLIQSELWQAPRTGAIGDVLAPDRLFFDPDDHNEDEWSLRDSGEEARCWEDYDDLGNQIVQFLCDADDDLELSCESSGSNLSFRGTEAAQKRVKWVIDALRDVSDARVNMVVYRLKDDTELPTPTMTKSEVPGWTKGARYVGTFRGGLAEPFVLQQTQHRSYVADYDTSTAQDAAIASPRVNDLHTGEEFVLGAASLSDGRLWVQGWHATLKLNDMRKVTTSTGAVEMPDVSYSFAPVSAVIENGGGAIIDAGPSGRFMVRAECDRVVRNHELKLDNGGSMRLINCIGGMRGDGLGGFWLMNPTSSSLMEDSMFPQVMLEDVNDGPYLDAAYYFSELLEDSSLYCDGLGPYLGVIIPSPEDLYEEDLVQRGEELAELDAIPVAPQTASVRITAYEVADDSQIPAGVLTGRPSAADIAELKTIARNKSLFNRVSMNLLRQQSDQFEVRLATHLRGYDSVIATGVTALDPEVGTLVLGEQIRWQARDVGEGRLRIEVRSGITVGGEKFERVAVGTDGLSVERSRSALTQARLGDELAIGERMAGISPGVGVDGQLVVIVVERLK